MASLTGFAPVISCGSPMTMWEFGSPCRDDEPSPSPHEMENSGQSVQPRWEKMNDEHKDKYIPGDRYNSHVDKPTMTIVAACNPRWRFEQPAKG